jgi:RNA polymerase sigma-70 factor (ECF subfamily)
MGTELAADKQTRFEALYERHAKSVLAYFLRRCDSETARDGTAEVFLVAWRRLPDVPKGDETIRWLYGTARRVLANQRRAQVRRVRLLDRIRFNEATTQVPPDVAVIRREEDSEVHDALRRLKDDDQELLRLALWEELPREDLAAYLGCNRHAVAQRVHRATRRLAKEITLAEHRRRDAGARQGEIA